MGGTRQPAKESSSLRLQRGKRLPAKNLTRTPPAWDEHAHRASAGCLRRFLPCLLFPLRPMSGGCCLGAAASRSDTARTEKLGPQSSCPLPSHCWRVVTSRCRWANLFSSPDGPSTCHEGRRREIRLKLGYYIAYCRGPPGSPGTGAISRHSLFLAVIALRTPYEYTRGHRRTRPVCSGSVSLTRCGGAPQERTTSRHRS